MKPLQIAKVDFSGARRSSLASDAKLSVLKSIEGIIENCYSIS